MHKLAEITRNAAVKAVGRIANGGVVVIYGGERPAHPEQPATVQPLLVELDVGEHAFDEVKAGEIATGDVTARSPVKRDGRATWFRLYAADGNTALLDGSVGATGADMNLRMTDLLEGSLVQISRFSYRLPEQ